MDLEDRVKRLERRCARLTVMLVLLARGLGCSLSVQLLRPYSDDSSKDTIDAEEFRVVDKSGRVHAVFGREDTTTGGNARVVFFGSTRDNEKWENRTELSYNELRFYNSYGSERNVPVVWLNAGAGNPSLFLAPKGGGEAVLTARGAGIKDEKATLVFYDNKKEVVFSAP